MHIRRPETLIKFSRQRADQGDFFVVSDGFDIEALSKLLEDEIIGYDQDQSAYFIAHDIYEEWALERAIEATFLGSSDSGLFYQKLGNSLAVRRAFRVWLVDKLTMEKESVKRLVEDTVGNPNIASFWQDEVLVSILLSDEAAGFIEMFGDVLMNDGCKLLVKLTFLLRIACKEVDSDTLRVLKQNKDDDLVSLLFTQPKGSGWDAVISYINDVKIELGTSHIDSIIQLLKDWTSKNCEGVTTKHSAQIALFYYEQIIEKEKYGIGSLSRQSREAIISVIRFGAVEIKDELADMVSRIIAQGQTHHTSKHRELIDGFLCTSYETVFAAKSIPMQLLQLAEAYWRGGKEERSPFRSMGVGVESDFGLSGACDHKYVPSSPYQTPIYTLLTEIPSRL